MQDYKKLVVWQKAHSLTKEVYNDTKVFPKEELFGLTSQIRRAAASIPTNIVEGCGRGTNPDLTRFLQITCGSAYELEYLIFLCFELGFFNKKQFIILDTNCNEIKKMLIALIHKTEKK